ncbi:DUF4238 domain-containing protein [Sphingobacterium sp. JUb56]|uniref:DUF4238 domain-containing protein n=1 Tax=Sphingobacterium sp. JUb56 TaxID=2587145 RepID=UPI0016070693|nr:DUF4238 domain-containing protein [Sphingobacterium sp. JUb56]MBB2950165.1 hypothetical protein [Sphingobacterium sp. JUb56]
MKTGDPIDHHYVPRVYLKRFVDEDNYFHQLCKQYRSISRKTTRQVCYEKNYFKIQREESKIIRGISDDYYIEKNAFTSQENSYSDLADLISQKQEVSFKMTRSQLELLLATLVTIKRRNPTTRDSLTNTLKKDVSAGGLEERFKPYMGLARRVDKVDPTIYLRKMKEEFINEPSKAEDLYTGSFIDQQSTIVKKVTETFLLSAIQIYHAPTGHEFFTSDNPGFVLSGNEVINFGGLGDSYLFGFPISPTVCLIIDSDKIAQQSVDGFTIFPKVCTEEELERINWATALIANKKLFMKDRDYMANFRDRYMK